MFRFICLYVFFGLLTSCSHQGLSDGATNRFSSKKIKAEYVLDSEVTMTISNTKGRPIIQVDLPHSRGCQVWIDQDYPGNVYPEQITNNVEKIDPIVYVLKYDSRCMKDKMITDGTQYPSTPMTSQIDLYAQIIDSKLPQFKKDFESGNLKIAVCRFWDCSELISFNDSLKPMTFYRSDYQPPKFVDLSLGEAKPIRSNIPLVQAIHGPPVDVCDGQIKQFPTLSFTLFLPSLSKKLVSSSSGTATDTRYIFRFHKGQLISREQGDELARKGEVFCSVRVVEQKSPKAAAVESFEFAPLQAIAFASNFGATYYSEKDGDLLATRYFSRTFELYGNINQQNFAVTGGFCSTPKGDLPSGRQVLVGDIVENIPGVSLLTNYPPFYASP